MVPSLRWFSFDPLVTNTSGKEPYYKTAAQLEELEKLYCEGLQVGAKAWQPAEVVKKMAWERGADGRKKCLPHTPCADSRPTRWR